MAPTININDEIKKGEIIFHGIPFHCLKNEIIVEIINNNIKNSRVNNHISITNTESAFYANKYTAHINYINRATLSFCDGVGIEKVARFKGINIKRYHGPDFMDDTFRVGQALGWRHYLLGGKQEVVEQLSSNLLKKYPQIVIAGMYSPPFRELSSDEEEEMIQSIKKANVDILWVGLGLLKQEHWIGKYKNRIHVPWSIGVGAAFDYHAGNKRRPPKWIQNVGFEWLYRLFWEPRMFKRNINSLIFLLHSIRKS